MYNILQLDYMMIITLKAMLRVDLQLRLKVEC